MGKDDGMKKDAMSNSSKDAMKKDDGMTKDRRHEEGRRDDEGRHEKRRRHEEELSRRLLFASGSPRAEAGLRHLAATERRASDPLLLLALAALAGRVARIALGLRFGLEGHLPGGLFFLFAGELGGGCSRSFRLARLLLGLGGFAGLPGLGTGGSLRLALGLALLDLGIVRAGLGLELVEDVLPRLLGRLLAVGEAGFLEFDS